MSLAALAVAALSYTLAPCGSPAAGSAVRASRVAMAQPGGKILPASVAPAGGALSGENQQLDTFMWATQMQKTDQFRKRTAQQPAAAAPQPAAVASRPAPISGVSEALAIDMSGGSVGEMGKQEKHTVWAAHPIAAARAVDSAGSTLSDYDNFSWATGMQKTNTFRADTRR